MSKSSEKKSTAAVTQSTDPFAAAYQATAEARAALVPDQLLAINLDVQLALNTVFAVVPKLRVLREEIKATFKSFDFEQYDAINDYAGALSYANDGYGATAAPTDVLPSVLARAVELRELLLGDAMTLGRRKLLETKPLEDLKGTSGYLNVVHDLGVLSLMLRARWDDVKSKSAVQESEIDEARKFVSTMTLGHAARSQSSDGVTAAASDRQRAYTLMVKAYDEARRAAMYLRYHQEDVATYLPSLWAGRKRAKDAAADAPVVVPSGDAPVIPSGDEPVIPMGDEPVIPMDA